MENIVFRKCLLFALAALPVFGFRPDISSVDVAEFVPVSIESIANHPLDHLATFEAGEKEFRGIAFSFPAGPRSVFQTQHHLLPAYPTSAELPLNIRCPVKVFVLLGGGYVYKNLEGKTAGEIILSFENGSQLRRTLVVGENLRENWAYVDKPTPEAGASEVITELPESGGWMNVFSEEQWRGASALGLIDMVTIAVPPPMRYSTLTMIKVTDLLLDPSIIVYAITVEARGDRVHPIDPRQDPVIVDR